MQENGYQADARLGRASFMPYETDSSGWLLFPAGQSWPEVEVIIAGTMRAMCGNDPVDIAVVLTVDKVVDRRIHEVHEIYAQVYRDIPVASAQQTHALAEIRASLTGCLDAAMRQVISILADTQVVDSNEAGLRTGASLQAAD
jgi:hypothetical protein